MVKNLLTKSKNFVFLMLMAVSLASCTRVEISGNQIDMDRVSKISKGDHADKLMSVMGSPTYIDRTTKDIKYIYIQEKLRHRPIVSPVLEDLDIVTFVLDKNEKVKEVVINENATPNHDIEMMDKRTMIKGNEINPLRQMLGNVGKYNSSKKSATGL